MSGGAVPDLMWRDLDEILRPARTGLGDDPFE
jgi:hypothetical protein